MTHFANSFTPRVRFALLTALALTSCSPYSRYSGEYNAGPVDPVNFPPENLGLNGDRLNPGGGVFVARPAYVNGAPVEYFRFSFTNAQLLSTDPLLLSTAGVPTTRARTPLAYVFDPTETNPIPTPARCAAPENYAYDPVVDDVAKDEQGNIFTALPSATYAAGAVPTSTYVPLVAQVPVTSGGQACQDIKSEKTLMARSDVEVAKADLLPGQQPSGVPDGKLLAWAIIDPGAAVYHAAVGTEAPTPSTGVGLQKWGWFKHYLLAYLDGGYVPTVDAEAGTPPRPVKRMKTQVLYYPRSPVGSGTAAKPGVLGAGYDVLEAKRGDASYSPVCQVLTYDLIDPVPVESLPKNASEIVATYGSTLKKPDAPAPAYVYCLQLGEVAP